MKFATIVVFCLLLAYFLGTMVYKIQVSGDSTVIPTVYPTNIPYPTLTPVPQYITCDVNGKTVYTKTQEDCNSLQNSQTSNSDDPLFSEPMPCSAAPGLVGVPCIRGL